MRRCKSLLFNKRDVLSAGTQIIYPPGQSVDIDGRRENAAVHQVDAVGFRVGICAVDKYAVVLQDVGGGGACQVAALVGLEVLSETELFHR